MIVRIVLTSDNIIKSVSAEGHAGEEKAGDNIVCAASTALIRSAYRTAALRKKISFNLKADKPGSIFFEIKEFEDKDLLYLAGITDYLITGLRDLEAEYPDKIGLELN